MYWVSKTCLTFMQAYIVFDISYFLSGWLVLRFFGQPVCVVCVCVCVCGVCGLFYQSI